MSDKLVTALEDLMRMRDALLPPEKLEAERAWYARRAQAIEATLEVIPRESTCEGLYMFRRGDDPGGQNKLGRSLMFERWMSLDSDEQVKQLFYYFAGKPREDAEYLLSREFLELLIPERGFDMLRGWFLGDMACYRKLVLQRYPSPPQPPMWTRFRQHLGL